MYLFIYFLDLQIATDKFLSITYLMLEAMGPVTVLSQFFQTENLDIALIKVHVHNISLEENCDSKCNYITLIRVLLAFVNFSG